MKKILVIIIVLFTAIVTMAYLYFSGLNAERKNSDSSLHAATLNAALVLSFENDKSIIDILSGQDLFHEIAGDDKYKQLQSLRAFLASVPAINKAIDKQAIYISLIPGKEKDVNFLYSTQITSSTNKAQLTAALKANTLSLETLKVTTKIKLKDSTIFYLGIKDNLLLLSIAEQPVLDALANDPTKSSKFTDYIKANSRITKNSLAEVYINFEALPELLKAVMPGKLTGELSLLSNQHAFASLTYNFSKEKILLTGITTANDADNYHQLFANLQPQKITITNILPDNTANYVVYAIGNYADWYKQLNEWFVRLKEDKAVSGIIKNNNLEYHIDLNQVFPKYTKTQFICFQLSTTEKIGAIQLSNGDKVNQLLLDLSTEYSTDIKVLKEDDLLYAYFGTPLKKFKRPFYTIIDNYMVFANNASTVQSFLNSYKNNRLLVNDNDYINAVNQLANTTNISFFTDLKNSTDIFRNNIYLPYYKHMRAEKGLKNYTAFTYQMSGDNGKFQTNVLLNRKNLSSHQDSIGLNPDSLISGNDSLTILPQQ